MLYKTTKEAWQAMIDACKIAKYSIDCEQYILMNDPAGHDLLDVLIDKQREGVKVRLHCDMVGSHSLYISEYPKKLTGLAAEVRFFNPISYIRVDTFFSWFFRTHRKILIVDSKIGFTGGVGFSDHFREWRDTHIKIEDENVIDEMKDSFDKLWEVSEHHDIVNRIRTIRGEGPKRHFVSNTPYFKKRFLYYTFVKAIKAAKERVYITVPYFVPDARMLRTLILAQRRGVDVKLIFPKWSDVYSADSARRSFYTRLLKAGIRIFEYGPEMIHAKTIVIDKDFSSVGSFNFDNLSFTFNHEGNLISREKDLNQSLEKMFMEDLEKSEEVKLQEWQKRSLLSIIREMLVIPFRRLL